MVLGTVTTVFAQDKPTQWDNEEDIDNGEIKGQMDSAAEEAAENKATEAKNAANAAEQYASDAADASKSIDDKVKQPVLDQIKDAEQTVADKEQALNRVKEEGEKIKAANGAIQGKKKDIDDKNIEISSLKNDQSYINAKNATRNVTLVQISAAYIAVATLPAKWCKDAKKAS